MLKFKSALPSFLKEDWLDKNVWVMLLGMVLKTQDF